MRLGILSVPFTIHGLFVVRILFHGSLLVLYPLILVYLVIGWINASQWNVIGTTFAGIVATALIFSLLLLYASTSGQYPMYSSYQ